MMEISIYVLMGRNMAKIIRLLGMIKKRKVSIWIDSGSTHSFIDEEFVQSINYKIQPAKPTSVTVAGGEKLISKGVCNPLVWKMQNLEFQYQLMVFLVSMHLAI
ncbi:Hypothetical predicted protein [Olea europaea subsp. europaea]|uniref:Uncharacterized protein n=1 Tax=Olea europaea subsp. europaea TaxID=158383 RepID=A0A8S0RBZ5_OLEEU|nr:Hypothetical predicted protein [Olea europaea subsp. europaea]